MSHSIRPVAFRQVYEEFDVSQASRLGSGGFGKVYKIRHKTTGKKFAAKYQKLTNEKMRKLVHEETYFLKRLSEGKRVVDIYNYYEKDKHSLMVLELLEGGELFSVVGASNYTLTELKCAHFTLDMLKAVNYIHENRVIHLDLKPQNIMMRHRQDPGREDYRVKLIDFGLAKELDANGRVRTGFAGTVGFMAPEVANAQYKQDYASPASDLFSLGVIVYMLVSGGREPFWDGSDIRAIKNTLKKEVSFAHPEFSGVSAEARDFIQRLLEKQQSRRMTGNQCLGHSWLRQAKEDEPDQGYQHGKLTHKILETKRMRKFMARHRWRKAIRAVRMQVRVKAAFALPGEGEFW